MEISQLANPWTTQKGCSFFDIYRWSYTPDLRSWRSTLILPTIHALKPEVDRLYKLINQPKEWDKELPEIKQILGILTANTAYQKGQLFKELDGKSYIFVRPSYRPKVIKVAHLLTGHGFLLKTMKKTNKNYYW